jgi:glutathione S-transferase
MTNSVQGPIKLFQFPRMFAIPNLSPFCCKLETWLRIARIPYEVVDTPDPRRGPKGKLPFIEDAGERISDTSLIIDYLTRTRNVDPDGHLDAAQRAVALLVQRTLEEHYAFVILYTHFIRAEGWQHTRASFDSVPTMMRPLVASLVRKRMRKILWAQGILRHSDENIIDAGLHDWGAVLAVRSDAPFFFGDEPTGIDAVVFAGLATTVLTPIESPIKEYLRAQPGVIAYAERMRAHFFPELAVTRPPAGQAKANSPAVEFAR